MKLLFSIDNQQSSKIREDRITGSSINIFFVKRKSPDKIIRAS